MTGALIGDLASSARAGPSQRDEAELRSLLAAGAILRSGPEVALRDRRGAHAGWMLDTWRVTLTPRGAELAGRCLVDRLAHFSSTQIAARGYTGAPLLTACLLAGDGRLTGLMVRKEPKGYGHGRLVEGPIDRFRPVVIIDDSLSSGTSLAGAIAALEAEGLRIEGAICLVHLPGRGGREWLRARGYRIETVFDVWDDLDAPRALDPRMWRGALPDEWARERVPDGLTPAEVARFVSEKVIRDGAAPRPPERLDAEHDARGGVFVSLRDRATDLRRARGGFWHFDPEDADLGRDVVLATLVMLQAARPPIRTEDLSRLKTAVTLFGPLQRCRPGEIDFRRHGILVRATSADLRLGGALPNTQVFTGEAGQLHQARRVNARLGVCDGFELFRHEVAKSVEPGQSWPRYGAPEDGDQAWADDPDVGQKLVDRVRAVLATADGAEPAGEPLADDLIPETLFGVAVSLYAAPVATCSIAWGDPLDSCVVRATRSALADQRRRRGEGGLDTSLLTPVVSLLHTREWHGIVDASVPTLKQRPGVNALAVHRGDHGAVFLPVVAVHHNLDRAALGRALLAKAGLDEGKAVWSTFRVAAWVEARPGDVRSVVAGLPAKPTLAVDVDSLRADAELMAAHLECILAPDLLPAYLISPCDGRRSITGSPARRIHAAATLELAGRILERPGWREAGLRGLRAVLDPQGGPEPEVALDDLAACVLLSAALDSGDASLRGPSLTRLGARVLALLHPDGGVTADPAGARLRADHDVLPGAAVLAASMWLSTPRRAAGRTSLLPQLLRSRERFRLAHSWPHVGWAMQAWGEAHRQLGDPDFAATAIEMSEWAREWQLRTSGAFLTDMWDGGPSFHTAFIAEGVAAAWGAALRAGQHRAAEQCELSWREAMRFLRTLVLRPDDACFLADPPTSIGGVRGAPTVTLLRVDFTSHALAALCRGLALLGARSGAEVDR